VFYAVEMADRNSNRLNQSIAALWVKKITSPQEGVASLWRNTQRLHPSAVIVMHRLPDAQPHLDVKQTRRSKSRGA
jgi:hypothetical protein